MRTFIIILLTVLMVVLMAVPIAGVALDSEERATADLPLNDGSLVT